MKKRMGLSTSAFHADPAVDKLLQDCTLPELIVSRASPDANPKFAVPERMTIAELRLAVFERSGRDAADKITIALN